MSAQPLAPRRGWVAALVGQLSEFVFEAVEEAEEPRLLELEPHPVVAVVSAAPRSGASTVARLLAAELAFRAAGAAVVVAAASGRRGAPPGRAALRLATALSDVDGHPCGRLFVATSADVVRAARYLAPVVLDLPPDGAAAEAARRADRLVVVGAAGGEPALLDALAAGLGAGTIKVVSRVVAGAGPQPRANVQLPDSRLAARSAALGARAGGPLGAAVARLADALEVAS